MKCLKITILAALAFAGAAFAAVAEGDCKADTYGAITVSYTDSKCVAVIDGDSEVATTIENVTVDSVIYKRTFNSDVASLKVQTIVLPFSASAASSCMSGAEFFTFNGVTVNQDAGRWQASAWAISFSNNEIKADSTYLIRVTKAESGPNSITFSACEGSNYVLNADGGEHMVVVGQDAESTLKQGHWDVMGTYAKKTFSASEVGHVYGFAAKNVGETSVGQFVMAGEGAYIKPFRAYLKYHVGEPTVSKSLAKQAAVASIDESDLPETIDVVFYDENGVPQSIGRMNAATGAVVMDSRDVWFDLNGRMMNQKPTVKGTYYHKGRKETIK